MKKNLKLIFINLVIVMLFLMVGTVNAANTTLDASPTSVTEGDTINITVTVNAAQWNLTLTANGTTLNTWTETVNYKENLSKTFTTSYKTTKEGTVNFVLSGDITDVDQTNTEINTSKSVTVKAKTTTSTGSSSGSSSSNSGSSSSSSSSGSSSSSSSSGSSTTTTKVTFTDVNETVYTTGSANVRASYSTDSKILATLSKGDSVTRTGKGSNGWSRVKYNGTTAYISSSLLTTTKPVVEEPEEAEKSSNKNLISLKIEGITLTPEFSSDVTQYTATVESDVEKLDVEAKVEDSKAKVTIEGNEELKEGSNIIKIKVTAEDNTTRTYFIDVTKGAAEDIVDNTLKLTNLQISGVDFTDGFNPDMHSYELNLNFFVNNLDITAVASEEDTKIEVIGNENFKEGLNSITILLTSADGSKTATYQIKVNVPAATEVAPELDIQFYIVCGIITLIAVIAIVVVIIVYNRKNKDEEAENTDNIEEISNEMVEEEIQTNKESIKKAKGRHSK